MILQELVRYYARQRSLPDSDIAPPGWIRRPVDYLLVLDESGQCLNLQPLFEVERGRRIGKQMLLPAIGKQARKHTNSGQDANLLWDNASFVLGTGERGTMKLASFMKTLENWLPESADVGVQAVRRFLSSIQEDSHRVTDLIDRQGARADFDERDLVLAFRLASDGPINVHERDAVRSVYEASTQANLERMPRGACMVTGSEDVPLAPNETVITGVWHAQSAGANLVSFNAASFISYGKQGRHAKNAPISTDASSAYSTSLSYLLASPRRRVQVGDASTVFWADAPSRFDSEFTLPDYFGESKDDPARGVRAVQALSDALKSGQLPVGERDVRFFVLGLAPNEARISVRFWLHAPLSDLAPRILRHFADLRVVRRYDSDPLTPSLHQLLRCICLQEDMKHLPPRIGGEWVRSILEGLPFPMSVLNAAVIRCRTEQAARDQRGQQKDNVPYLRAAVIKAWLNRWIRVHHPGGKEFSVALDTDNCDVPYRLGRLFAAYERIQSDSAGRDLNRTIRDAYFGSAMATPASVFPRLMRLNQHHMRDLRRSSPGLHAIRDRLLIGIADGIDAAKSFPSVMRLPDQGRFALGYYHQRQAFFTRKDAGPATATPEE